MAITTCSNYELPMFGRYFVAGLDNNETIYDCNGHLSPCGFTLQALRREGI